MRVYEVYWADLLEGDQVKGSFDPWEFHSIAWFPWLNLKAGLYPNSGRVRVLFWTILLTPVAMAAQLAYRLVRVAVSNTVFDRTLADVTNYVRSAARVLPEESSLRTAASQILGRLYASLERAAADGCQAVYIIAHSLGSVIAYHGLSQHLADNNRPPVAPKAFNLVRGLYTIGSPLEKIRFIWPGLIATQPPSPARDRSSEPRDEPPDFRWENFYNPLDLVSGRLRHSQNWGIVNNHRLLGRAGFARAHTNYESNPSFVEVVTGTLFGQSVRRRISLWESIRLLAASIGESLAVVAVLALGLLIATVTLSLLALVFAGFAACNTIFEYGWALRPGQQEEFFNASVFFILVLLGVFFALGPPLYGRVRGGLDHYLHLYQEPAVVTSSRLTLWLKGFGENGNETAPSSESAPKPESPWLHTLLLWLVGGLVSFALGVYVLPALTTPEVDLPWAENASTIWRVASPFLFAFFGLLVLVTLSLMFVLLMGLLWSLLRGIAAYTDWLHATTTPPGARLENERSRSARPEA